MTEPTPSLRAWFAYDYTADGFSPDAVARLEAYASQIDDVAGMGLLEIGRLLNQAKAEFGANDSAFGRWRAARVPWLSAETARAYQAVATRFGDTPQINLGGIGRTVLYWLAKPSTPDAVVQTVALWTSEGRPVKVKDVRKLVSESQTALPPPATPQTVPADRQERATQKLNQALADFAVALDEHDPPPLREEDRAKYTALRATLSSLAERLERLLQPTAPPQTAPQDRQALAEIGHKLRQQGHKDATIADLFNRQGWTPDRIPKAAGVQPRADSATAWTAKAVSQLIVRDRRLSPQDSESSTTTQRRRRK